MIDAELDTGGEEPDDDLPDITSADLSSLKKQIPDDLDKIVQDKVKEEQKKIAAEQKRQRLLLKREHQDETRQRRIQSKLDKRAATDRRIGIRSSAVSQRIQSYSIASSLGFAGYVAASIVDQFYIRPREDAAIAAEDKYNAEYAKYQQDLEQDQIDRRRQREDEISGMSPDESSIRSNITNTLPDKKPDDFGGTPSNKYRQHVEDTLKRTDLDPRERQYYLDKQRSFPPKPTLDQDPRYTSRERPERTRSREFLDTDEELDENGVPISRSPVSGTAFNAARSIPEVAKAIAPVVPEAAVSFLEKAGPIGLAVAAGVTAAQLANQKIAEAGDAIGKVGKSTFTGPVTAALRDQAEFVKATADPLGVNIPLQVAVTGFEVLLSLTESIKSYAEKDKEFSPLTLQSSIEGDIARLMQSIDLANKNDPLKAAFTEAMTQLDLVWNEFKAEAFQKIGPALIAGITVLSANINTISQLSSGAYNIAKYMPNGIGIMINILESIAEAMKKDPIAGNTFDQIRDFMNPTNNADLPGRAFKNKMPNMVP